MTNEALVRVEWPRRLEGSEASLAGCALVTLNRPQAMNALSLALRHELVATFDALTADADARVVVLTGAGPSAFCAGLDLKELGAELDITTAVMSAAEQDPIAAMARFPGPIIGAINGVAITGGFELALACDFLVASSNARFADTHVRVGVMPGWGLSQKLPRLIGPARAKELSLTGNFIDAWQAAAWGLVNHVVAPEELLPRALALAADMLSALPEMVPAYKRLIDEGLAGSLEQGLLLEQERARAWAAQMKPEEIERRRQELAQRGRGQVAASDPPER